MHGIIMSSSMKDHSSTRYPNILTDRQVEHSDTQTPAASSLDVLLRWSMTGFKLIYSLTGEADVFGKTHNQCREKDRS